MMLELQCTPVKPIQNQDSPNKTDQMHVFQIVRYDSVSFDGQTVFYRECENPETYYKTFCL